MAAFKQFTTKDVVITPFEASKGFNFAGTAITGSTVGIEIYAGIKPGSNIFVSSSVPSTGFVYKENTTGVYYSVKHLYYSNYVTSSLGDNVPLPEIVPGVSSEDTRYVGAIEAPRYDNYLQSTLTQSRYFPTASGAEISVVSIPAKLFGENIVPSTFELLYTSSGGNGYLVTDDGNGNLVLSSISGSYGYYGTGSYGSSSYGPIPGLNEVIGQIFYSHGLAVITTGDLSNMGSEMSSSLTNLDKVNVAFSSSFKIYEHQYKCSIRDNEFDYSLNPTLLSGSNNDTYYDFATGSYFNPYVTTVGLYNENNELLVVGKLSQPIPISRYVDTTIIVNFDV